MFELEVVTCLKYIKRLLLLFRRIPEEINPIFTDFIDPEMEREIEDKNRNYSIFQAIVGENPFDQIDWIIKHGFEKYHYYYMCYENRTLYAPATVKEAPKQVTYSGDTIQHYVSGGRGNAKLISFRMTRSIEED
jgi:hypothetical protein